jgi:hypothetical protein
MNKPNFASRNHFIFSSCDIDAVGVFSLTTGVLGLGAGGLHDTARHRHAAATSSRQVQLEASFRAADIAILLKMSSHCTRVKYRHHHDIIPAAVQELLIVMK